ncbi:MAG: hypothetical protein KKD76_02305 [Verrucomicrobia bacterium]|nr:hypothetical protein [Verrucomicrobiota bacterium]
MNDRPSHVTNHRLQDLGFCNGLALLSPATLRSSSLLCEAATQGVEALLRSTSQSLNREL